MIKKFRLNSRHLLTWVAPISFHYIRASEPYLTNFVDRDLLVLRHDLYVVDKTRHSTIEQGIMRNHNYDKKKESWLTSLKDGLRNLHPLYRFGNINT
jgi:hypothetical protein